MTTAADEDNDRVLVCSDQRRLIEAALRLGRRVEYGAYSQKRSEGAQIREGLRNHPRTRKILRNL